MKAYLVYEMTSDEYDWYEWSAVPTGVETQSSIAIFMNLKTAKEYIANNSKRYLEYEELEIIED